MDLELAASALLAVGLIAYLFVVLLYPERFG